jgi:hypothetical protein
MIASASATLPFWSSQRGLSGRRNRIYQPASALVAPISTTQRQPSSPNGACGTSSQASSAQVGTAVKPKAWLQAKARPRMWRGTNSAI